MQELTKALAWQEAIALSQSLVHLIEEFSDGDRNVIVHHLRKAVVEIPASVAADLTANRKPTMEPVVKLFTELELINKIYPAIDAGDAEAKLATLVERMQSKQFSEREPEPEPEVSEVPEAAAAPATPTITDVSAPEATVSVQEG